MTRRQFLIAAASAAGLAATAGVREAYTFQIERIRATVPALAAPVRVALLCDLHFGPYIREGSIRSWVDAALAEDPDLIVLGGDLVDQMGGGEPSRLVAGLGRLQAPLGVYAVWGNHDRKRLGELPDFESRLSLVGIQVLVNRGAKLRHDLFLAGIDDYRMGRPDLAAALQERGSAATVLVSHNPDVLPEVPEDVDLTLCGHTHGGQIQIPGIGPILTSSEYGRRFAEGWKRAPALGYVSRGLGVGWVPVRIACPAELTIIDLRPGADPEAAPDPVPESVLRLAEETGGRDSRPRASARGATGRRSG